MAARVVDLRWLAPLPVEDLLREASATGRVLVVDETRRTGGVSEGIIAALVDAKFDGQVARVASADSFIPLGDAANLVLVSEQDVMAAAAGAGRGARLIRAALAVIVVAALGLAAAVIWWSGATLAEDNVALAKVEVQPLGGSLVSAKAFGPGGRRIPVSVSGGRLLPRKKLTPGEEVSVVVVVRRPGWLGWALGKTRTERLAVQAPIARLAQRWPSLAPNAPLRLHYVDPVDRVVYRVGTRRTLVPVGGSVVSARRRRRRPGTALVAAAARSWERLGRAGARDAGSRSRSSRSCSSAPRPARAISPLEPIRLTFSQPVSEALGAALPRSLRRRPGRWRQPTATRSSSRRAARLPARPTCTSCCPPVLSVSVGSQTAARPAVAWTVPPGVDVLRLQQLLAQDGYLPLSWQPAGADVARTARREVDAAVDAAGGQLQLALPEHAARAAARCGARTAEPDHARRGDDVRARPRPRGRRHRRPAGLAARCSPTRSRASRRHGGYSYVYVHRNVPQLLTLWHNGRIVLTSPGNTGVPAAPTELGTFPVFEHIPVGTMSGTNPDGSHYHDPGIRWISYFNGGDALHAFNRALLRHAAEPRLRRAAARDGGEGLAVHADRHAGHDRELNRAMARSSPIGLILLVR